MRRYTWLSVICVLLLVLPTAATASPPAQEPPAGPTAVIGYQGVLTEPDGTPLAGSVRLQFRLYSAAVSGTLLWDSGPMDVVAEQGVVSVGLPIDQALLTGRRLWLALSVNGQSLSPRQELLAVPYAAGLLPHVQVVGQSDGDVLSSTNSGTGAGLRGASARGYGVYGYSERGVAVYGENTGSTEGAGYGGYFASNTGVGAYGASTAPASVANPQAPGVHGHSVNGVGVYGTTDASPGAGVLGTAGRGTGVEGRSDEGSGLRGESGSGPGLWAGSATGLGAHVRSDSGVGLEAVSQGPGATAHGVLATAQGGQAVRAASATNVAIWAEAGDPTGVYEPTSLTAVVGRGEDRGVFGGTLLGSGVEGISESGAGVQGRSTSGYGGYFTSANSRAVYARNLSGTWYDAWFAGDVGIKVEGTVYAGGLNVQGDMVASGGKSGYVVEIALNAGPESLETGDVVEVAGVAEPVVGEIPVPLVRPAREAGSHRVLGVVHCAYDAAAGRFAAAEGERACRIEPGGHLGVVTLGAYRAVKADATGAAIEPGDLLVSSSLPGHAAPAEGPTPGTLVGKALGPLDEGTGVIPVMVTLQ